MLMRKLYGLKFLFLFCFLPSLALAEVDQLSEPWASTNSWSEINDWSWFSRLRAQGNVHFEQKPSSKNGQTDADWGSLEMDQVLTNDHEPLEVGIGTQFGPDRDKNSQQPLFQWNELRFTWTHKPRVSFGILIDPVIAFDEANWGEASVGLEFRSGAERWGVLPRSDAGLQWSQETEWGRWFLQITNGEGWPNPELGARKDYELVWQDQFTRPNLTWETQVFFRYGGYDQIDERNNVKQRLGGQLALHTTGHWEAGLLYVQLQDPVDAVDGKLGEGVDLARYGGDTNQAALSEGWFHYRWGETGRSWKFLTRSSFLQAHLGDSGKEIHSLVMGVGKVVGSGMQIDLLFQQVNFAASYSNKAEDRQSWFLAWIWGLERKPIVHVVD